MVHKHTKKQTGLSAFCLRINKKSEKEKASVAFNLWLNMYFTVRKSWNSVKKWHGRTTCWWKNLLQQIKKQVMTAKDCTSGELTQRLNKYLWFSQPNCWRVFVFVDAGCSNLARPFLDSRKDARSQKKLIGLKLHASFNSVKSDLNSVKWPYLKVCAV